VILINGPILAGTHPFGIAGRPDMRESFRAQLPQIRKYAETLSVHFVHILAGTTKVRVCALVGDAGRLNLGKTVARGLLLV
jgi:hydroxypyruvate isomerase